MEISKMVSYLKLYFYITIAFILSTLKQYKYAHRYLYKIRKLFAYNIHCDLTEKYEIHPSRRSLYNDEYWIKRYNLRPDYFKSKTNKELINEKIYLDDFFKVNIY